MSQIRSHIEYLMQIYYILVLILQSKLIKNLATMTGFNADLRMTRDSGLIFWATLYTEQNYYNTATQHGNSKSSNSEQLFEL